MFFFIDQEREPFYFCASGTTREKTVRIEGTKSIPKKFWSHGTSSAVIDTQVKLKERDKIISENSSLIPFVRYSEKNNFVHK